MELRHLAAVVAVVDEGTVTGAAAALHVTQPALSQTVRALERELGTPLFHRVGRGVVLTPAGEQVVASARQVLRDAETLRANVAAMAGLEGGRLDLVALPTLAVDPTASLIGAFRYAHPGVTVRLAEPEDTADVIAMLLDGRCEVGIADVGATPPGLIAIPHVRQRFHLVCPPDTTFPGRRKRRVISDLEGLPLVTTPRGTSTRRVVDDAMALAGLTPTVAVETAQREALLPLVLAGAGVTLLPGPLAAEAARRGAIVFDVDPPLTREVALLHRTGPLSPAAAAFVASADSH